MGSSNQVARALIRHAFGATRSPAGGRRERPTCLRARPAQNFAKPARVSENRTAFARKLRREMTQAEAMLWRSLRGVALDGLKFRRQVPIGRYVVDFLCVKHRLAVELDGAPHDRDE